MKKILNLLLILLLITSLVACSSNNTVKDTELDNTVSEETVSQESETLSASEEKTEQEPEKEEEVVVDKNLSPTPEVEEKKEETPKTATIDPYGYLGKSESSFIDSLKNLGFTNVVKIDSIYSNYPEGTICYYLPDGEQTLDKTIEYKVSIGQKPVEKQEEVQGQQNNQEDVTVVSDREWNDGEYAYVEIIYSDGNVWKGKQAIGVSKPEDCYLYLRHEIDADELERRTYEYYYSNK